MPGNIEGWAWAQVHMENMQLSGLQTAQDLCFLVRKTEKAGWTSKPKRLNFIPQLSVLSHLRANSRLAKEKWFPLHWTEMSSLMKPGNQFSVIRGGKVTCVKPMVSLHSTCLQTLQVLPENSYACSSFASSTIYSFSSFLFQWKICIIHLLKIIQVPLIFQVQSRHVSDPVNFQVSKHLLKKAQL